MTDRATLLEQLAHDMEDLVVDVQQAQTMDDEVRAAREGRRIAAAIRRLFDA